jgi:hypothetical protein
VPKTPMLVLAEVIADVTSAKRLVDHLILITPTSEARNKLTEANIHMMAAEQCLVEFRAANNPPRPPSPEYMQAALRG